MEIKELINEINRYAPSVDQIIAKRLSRNIPVTPLEAETIRDGFRLAYLTTEAVRGKLDDLIYNTNIKYIGTGGVEFDSEISLEADVYRCFASYNYYNEFCQRLTDMKIVVLDRETLLEGGVISESLDQFFYFLCLLTNYDRNVIYGVALNDRFLENVEELIRAGVSKKWVKILMPTLPLV
ncbi:hypothetical protein AB6805_14765 [Chitinophaga sp. RCC_12]|uniref:hypothetical protein n=1 Tax=Chitinophaga sp. RCC_12 TaxID=3239226 RepID=UPI003525A277